MAQLVEVRSWNPVIGKIYIEHLFTVNCVKKHKESKKRPGMAHLNIIKRIFLSFIISESNSIIEIIKWRENNS